MALILGITEWLCAYGVSQHGKDEVDKVILRVKLGIFILQQEKMSLQPRNFTYPF